jgi:hypothetical protein
MDKRHFTVVIGSKENGLYISSKPSSAAKKAVSKLCASNKSKKVEFCLREITQGSKKKTYGPYLGEMKKLKKPIELKGRVIRYEIKVHLKKGKSSTIKTAKKMRGGVIIDNTIRQNLIRTNDYRGALNAIFNRTEFLGNLYSSRELEIEGTWKVVSEYYPFSFIRGMIDEIDTFQENKYKFIICLIGIYAYSIQDYTIDKIGIDKIIEILFNTNYNEEEFSTIIVGLDKQFIPFNLQSDKKILFMRLLRFYSHKEEFNIVLKKLLSIRDMSIMTLEFIGNPLLYFLQRCDDGKFKLFKFLLDNKQELLEFIRILKNIKNTNGRGGVEVRELFSNNPEDFGFGTSEQRNELFKNV